MPCCNHPRCTVVPVDEKASQVSVCPRSIGGQERNAFARFEFKAQHLLHLLAKRHGDRSATRGEMTQELAMRLSIRAGAVPLPCPIGTTEVWVYRSVPVNLSFCRSCTFFYRLTRTLLFNPACPRMPGSYISTCVN